MAVMTVGRLRRGIQRDGSANGMGASAPIGGRTEIRTLTPFSGHTVFEAVAATQDLSAYSSIKSGRFMLHHKASCSPGLLTVGYVFPFVPRSEST